MPQPTGLQRPLHALRHRTHVGAASRPRAAGVDDDLAVTGPDEPDELALGPTLPTAETRARRRMAHVSVEGRSTSGADAAGASAAVGASAAAGGAARAASHSSAAA